MRLPLLFVTFATKQEIKNKKYIYQANCNCLLTKVLYKKFNHYEKTYIGVR